MLERLLAVAIVLPICACASDAASTASSAAAAAGEMVSCNNTQLGLCSEWRGLDKEQQQEAKASCKDASEVFGTVACKTDKLIGTCEQKDEHITIFMYPSEVVQDVKGAKEMCDDGVFTEAKP